MESYRPLDARPNQATRDVEQELADLSVLHRADPNADVDPGSAFGLDDDDGLSANIEDWYRKQLESVS